MKNSETDEEYKREQNYIGGFFKELILLLL